MNWRRGVYRMAAIVTVACGCIILLSIVAELLSLASLAVIHGIVVALVLLSCGIVLVFMIPLAVYVLNGFLDKPEP